MKEDNIKELSEGLSISILGKFGGRGIDLLIQVLLGNLLTSAAFGLYTIVSTLLRILGNIASIGLDKGVIRFGAHYWNTRSTGFKDVVNQSSLLSLLSGGVLAGLLFLAAPFIAEDIYKNPLLIPLIRAGSIYLIFFSAARVISNASRVAKNFSLSVFGFEFGFPAVELMLIGIFILVGISAANAVWAKVVAISASFLLSAVFLVSILRKADLKPDNKVNLGKSLLLYSFPVSLAGIFFNTLLSSDRLILGYYLSESEVGIYQAVNQFPSFFLLFLSAVNLVFFPLIGDLLDKKDHQELENLFKAAIRYGVYVSTPVLVFLLVFPAEVITVFFPDDFVLGVPALQILALAQFINVSTGSVGPLLILSNHQGKWLAANMIGFFVGVMLNFLLIPPLGLTGSAIGTGVGIIVLFMIGIVMVKKELDLWPYTRDTLKLFISLPIGLIAAYLLKTWISVPVNLLTLLLFSMATLVITAGVIILLGVHPVDRALFDNLVIQRFSGRKGGSGE